MNVTGEKNNAKLSDCPVEAVAPKDVSWVEGGWAISHARVRELRW